MHLRFFVCYLRYIYLGYMVVCLLFMIMLHYNHAFLILVLFSFGNIEE